VFRVCVVNVLFPSHSHKSDDSVVPENEKLEVLPMVPSVYKGDSCRVNVFVRVFISWCHCSHHFMTSCSVGTVTVDYRTSVTIFK
jgi:hypothetical protein